MAIVNITCENDADFIHGFAYQSVTGVPINLTGNTMKMGIRTHASDIELDLMLTTENGGIIITDAPNGQFTVYIKKDQLERLPVASYDHSLIRMIEGMQLRVWSGTLINNAGPSR
jgi:hypothetical protein